jgi:hypothetical protein
LTVTQDNRQAQTSGWGDRDRFARAAIAQIPKILTLCDRNPHSPTYGCFDRNYWQYKIVDFPSGMSQEFVLPLALVWALDLPDNPYYQQPNLREWVVAGIRYAAHSSHPDGSCDDYFPFERAGGAAAFSLLACLDACELIGLDDRDVGAFLSRRADWLAHHQESGRLTNHQALIVLCLELLEQRLNTDRWHHAKVDRLDLVFAWQDPEGWFQEYEGCDPGYHTLTISCLARLLELQGSQADSRLKTALMKAVELAQLFVHPDGSFGGEYTSRNTYNFFPHGFELVGRWLPSALSVNDRILQGLARGLGACYADDHIVGHHTWNYLLAWRDFVRDRPPIPDWQPQRVWLPTARLLVDHRRDDRGEPVSLFLALNKGGVFKLFRGDQLVAADTQFSLQVRQGKKLKNAVGHLVDRYDIQMDSEAIGITGNLGWAKQTLMTPAKLMILRVVMLTVGRFFPNVIRRILQQILIVGKQTTPYQFIRRLQWTGAGWQVTDELTAPDWRSIESVQIGTAQTSIYVVMSRTYQAAQLQPAWDLSDRARQLGPNAALKVDRTL